MTKYSLADFNRQKAMEGNWVRIYGVLQERPDAPLIWLADRTGVSIPTVRRAKAAIANGWKPKGEESK